MSTATTRRPTRSAALGVVFVLLLVVLTILVLIYSQREDMRPYSPQSTQPEGAGALSALLEEHGIAVTIASSPEEAAELADKHSTVLLTPQATAFKESVTALTESAKAVVVTGIDGDLLPWGFPGGSTIAVIESIPAGDCVNKNALAAGKIGPIATLYVPPTGATTGESLVKTCFSTASGAAWARSNDYRNVTLVPDPQFLNNENLAKHGNAAFALRELGSQPKLIWVMDKDHPVLSQDHTLVYTDWVVRILVGLLGIAAVYAFYRGRRFGPLVAEPLPVNVPVSEADTGRARLYERTDDFTYLANNLRANTLTRICPKLGLPPYSAPEDVVVTLHGASDISAAELTELLYERPITTKKELAELATQLENLERKFDVR